MFLPVSALLGDNLVELSYRMDWYKGPTFVEALDRLELPKWLPDRSLRLTLQGSHIIPGVGTVAVG